ncbi:hypothetical protein DYB31_005850 [Aphanomyces astaci]|uniref:SET domain-containing protein n=1 Tax=Aphanomyces astaci TaxID=112090 RepID=A0A397EYL1_APHAT|nr:hypothetical protein DYB31_005850 [Aphanomyces astaci]
MSEEVVLRKSDGLFYCPRCTVHYVNERAFRAHCKTKHGLKVTLFKKKSIEEKKAKARQRKQQRKATREALQAMAGKTFRLKQRALFTFAVARVRGAYQAANPIVKIDDSTVPGAGRGLFANVDLSAGDICTVYDGEKVYEEPTDHEYACQLGVVTTKSWLMGLKDPVAGRGLGSFVNRETRGRSGCLKNCQLMRSGNAICIKILKSVKAGKELFAAYGRGYRL